jgi:hypothetical protein
VDGDGKRRLVARLHVEPFLREQQGTPLKRRECSP